VELLPRALSFLPGVRVTSARDLYQIRDPRQSSGGRLVNKRLGLAKNKVAKVKLRYVEDWGHAGCWPIS